MICRLEYSLRARHPIRYKIRFSNCRCVQHHSRCYTFLPWRMAKYNGVKGRLSGWGGGGNIATSYTAVIIYPLCTWWNPSSIDFLDIIKQIVTKSFFLWKLHVTIFYFLNGIIERIYFEYAIKVLCVCVCVCARARARACVRGLV